MNPFANALLEFFGASRKLYLCLFANSNEFSAVFCPEFLNFDFPPSRQRHSRFGGVCLVLGFQL